LRHKANGIFPILISGLLLFSLSPGQLFSIDKKLKVVVDEARVHLDPSRMSAVVATLQKGTMVTLGSERKFRKNWNYIYFASKKKGFMKSGYIQDTYVERLSKVTKVITIQGDRNEENTPSPKKHFRNTRWGMNKENVLKIEGRPQKQETSEGLDIFQYPKKILNMDCLIGYVFAEDKLAKTKYSFFSRHENKDLYIQDYEKIKKILTQKYGKPQYQKVFWQDPEYKDKRSSWGKAVSSGRLEFASGWQDSETEILLRLFGWDGRIFLVAEYSSLKYKDLANKIRGLNQLDNF